jgi:hypothetical protein
MPRTAGAACVAGGGTYHEAMSAVQEGIRRVVLARLAEVGRQSNEAVFHTYLRHIGVGSDSPHHTFGELMERLVSEGLVESRPAGAANELPRMVESYVITIAGEDWLKAH